MTLLDPRLLLVAVAALVLSYGAGRVQQHGADTKAFQAERNRAALDAARAQIKATDEARIEEQRRAKQLSDIANEAKQQAETASADAGRARAESGRLRERVAKLVAAGRAAGYSSAASGGEAAGDPLDVLADVLLRADQRAGDLAEFADNAHIAGAACERAYSTLTGP